MLQVQGLGILELKVLTFFAAYLEASALALALTRDLAYERKGGRLFLLLFRRQGSCQLKDLGRFLDLRGCESL